MSYWSQFKRAGCFPDCNCELIRDAFIGQPSGFWTSVFYLGFALLLYTKVKERSLNFKLWILSFVLLGFSSLFAHGSFIQLALAMDFSSIVLVLSFFAVMRVLGQYVRNSWARVLGLVSYYTGLWFLFYVLDGWSRIILCVAIFCVSLAEMISTLGRSVFYAPKIQWSLGILLCSFLLFMNDEIKLFCEPESWLQGHSVWHLGSAWSLYLYSLWRFTEARTGKVYQF